MHPQPLFEIFGKGVYLYGVFIGIGLLACIWVLYYYTKKKGVPTYVQDFVFVSAIVGIALGFLAAKVFQAFYDYLATGEFDFYNAGITVMGGLVGGAIAFVITYFVGGKLIFKGKKKNIHLKHFNDIVLIAPICICIAHGFGRLGCLMGGCCHGTYLGQDYTFGGVWMRGTVKIGELSVKRWGYYIPTQLYEALFLFALFGVLSLLYFKRSNILMHIYLIAYGVWRIFIEFFRADYRGGAEGSFFAPSQWMSIAFIVGGIALFAIYKVFKLPYRLPEKPNDEKTKTKK
ncbi:MAG: prolipoprotein diacylglyceryl transferase [Clostridia bacterium]|nr:prolipoprotein diacylglyceryl transferase [Clostridia bacterium]